MTATFKNRSRMPQDVLAAVLTLFLVRGPFATACRRFAKGSCGNCKPYFDTLEQS